MARRPPAIKVFSTEPTFIESRMQSLMFAPLHADGSNFLEWTNDAKTVLSANDLARTLTVKPSTFADPAQQIPLAAKW